MANHLSPDRTAEIYAIVFGLVAEHGYDAVRIDQIAKAARVSTATIYRHWGSKSALVMSVLDSNAEHDAADRPDTGSLLGDLHAGIDARAEVLPSGVRFLLSVTLAMGRDEELARAYRERGLPIIVRPIEAILERAVARGEIAADAPIARLLTALALTPWVVSGVLLAEPVGADEAHEFIDTVLAPLLTLPAARKSS